MMIKRILTIGAAVAASSLAHAQQGYPIPPAPVYSASPGPYVPGGYAVGERRGVGVPDFDALEDDEAPYPQSSTVLPPPGPVLSPNDPRYGRPVYSDRGPPMPTGPVLSPDDPRYGRPAGPPPVIYADRPPGQQQPAYSDRGDSRIPGAGIRYPNDDRPGLRPPRAIGGAPATAPLTQPQRPARGARTMYLGSTIYRIHGTNQPSTIGKFVSSGCIGMLNEDVSDLFERAKVGTRVVVLPGGAPAANTASASAAPPPSAGPAAAAAPGPAQAQLAPGPGTQPTVVPPLPAPVTTRRTTVVGHASEARP